MTLDQSSRRNLEISESISGQGRSNTLLTVLDNTVTPMGARLLKNWMQQPLLEKEAIIESYLMENSIHKMYSTSDKLNLRDTFERQLIFSIKMEFIKSYDDVKKIIAKL
jgi:DNA mismatch repair ATPase MutS